MGGPALAIARERQRRRRDEIVQPRLNREAACDLLDLGLKCLLVNRHVVIAALTAGDGADECVGPRGVCDHEAPAHAILVTRATLADEDRSHAVGGSPRLSLSIARSVSSAETFMPTTLRAQSLEPTTSRPLGRHDVAHGVAIAAVATDHGLHLDRLRAVGADLA